MMPSPERLPSWTPGTLDIHHISTGRGTAAFLQCPDGTTMLIDAGAVSPRATGAQYMIDAFPSDTKRPGEWMARYVSRHIASGSPSNVPPHQIDQFLLTHFHDDHMGEFRPTLPQSKHGDYVTTGIADVAELLSIGKIVDRSYPTYSPLESFNVPNLRNYETFVRASVARGIAVEKFRPGADDQLSLVRNRNSYPAFHIRNLAGDGEVWTGTSVSTRRLFPDNAGTENMCSIAIRLTYGKFKYFTGGDLTSDTNYGADPWRDIETPVARLAGPVDVAVVNHHGYFDAVGPGFVQALRPRVFIVQAWDAGHPSQSALNNMLSRKLYPGDRDIYSTAIKPEARVAIRQLSELKSDNGHVIVRVSRGGDEYRIFITSNNDESDEIVKTFGPFQSGAGNA